MAGQWPLRGCVGVVHTACCVWQRDEEVDLRLCGLLQRDIRCLGWKWLRRFGWHRRLDFSKAERDESMSAVLQHVVHGLCGLSRDVKLVMRSGWRLRATELRTHCMPRSLPIMDQVNFIRWTLHVFLTVYEKIS